MPQTLSKFHKAEPVDGTVIYWGTEAMVIPEGGNHVRVCSIFLPPIPKNNAVTATVYSTDSTGQTFAIWSIQKGYQKDYTQIAFHASGDKSDWQYFIDYHVIAR